MVSAYVVAHSDGTLLAKPCALPCIGRCVAYNLYGFKGCGAVGKYLVNYSHQLVNALRVLQVFRVQFAAVGGIAYHAWRDAHVTAVLCRKRGVVSYASHVRVLGREVVGIACHRRDPVTTQWRALRHAYCYRVAKELGHLAVVILAIGHCVYRVVDASLRHCQGTAVTALFVQFGVCAVPFNIPLGIALALKVSCCRAYAGIGGADVGDDEQSFVLRHLGGVIVEREVPAAVAVCDLVALGAHLRHCGECRGNEHGAQKKNTFHKGNG